LVNKSSSSSKSTFPNKLLWFEIGTDGFGALELLICLLGLVFNDGRVVVGVCRPDVTDADDEWDRARWLELLFVAVVKRELLLALVGRLAD